MSDQSDRPRRRRRPPQQPPPAQGSVARGAVLVIIAVVIGFVLLRDDSSTTAQVSVGADTTAPDGSDAGDGDGEGDPDDTSTTTTLPPRPPSQVKVLVANGSEVNGAAGQQTDELEALGYVAATPTNAPERVPATIIYFVADYRAEAEAVAEAIGAPSTSVTEMPTVAPVDDLQLANILIVIGPDLAQGG